MSSPTRGHVRTARLRLRAAEGVASRDHSVQSVEVLDAVFLPLRKIAAEGSTWCEAQRRGKEALRQDACRDEPVLRLHHNQVYLK